MRELILIDFSWIYNKYFFVAKSKQFHEIEDKSLFQKEVTTMLSQLFTRAISNYPDAKFIAALDPPTTSLNNFKECSTYKQNRGSKKDVYAYVKDTIRELNNSLGSSFHFVISSGYEADQVIAELAIKFHDKCKVTIFSGDKDLIQLTSYDNVYTSEKFERGKFLIRTDQEIFDKFKNSKGDNFTRISTNKRDIIKYRVLKGDASDNLPPVYPRIKDSDIVDIIQNYWTSDEVLSDTQMCAIIESIGKDNDKLATKLDEARNTWLTNYNVMNLCNKRDMKIKKVPKNG